MEALMLVQQPIPPQLSPSPECSCWALPKTPQKCKVDQHCRFLASSLGSLNWKRDSSWILRYIGVRLSAGWVFFSRSCYVSFMTGFVTIKNSYDEYLGNHVAKPWEIERFFFYIYTCSVFNLWVSCSQEHFFLWILIPFICLPICLKRFLLGFVYTFVIVLSLVVFTPKCAPGVCLLTWPQEVIRFLGHSVGSKDGFCKGYYWT